MNELLLAIVVALLGVIGYFVKKNYGRYVKIKLGIYQWAGLSLLSLPAGIVLRDEVMKDTKF